MRSCNQQKEIFVKPFISDKYLASWSTTQEKMENPQCVSFVIAVVTISGTTYSSGHLWSQQTELTSDHKQPLYECFKTCGLLFTRNYGEVPPAYNGFCHHQVITLRLPWMLVRNTWRGNKHPHFDHPKTRRGGWTRPYSPDSATIKGAIPKAWSGLI